MVRLLKELSLHAATLEHLPQLLASCFNSIQEALKQVQPHKYPKTAPQALIGVYGPKGQSDSGILTGCNMSCTLKAVHDFHNGIITYPVLNRCIGRVTESRRRRFH